MSIISQDKGIPNLPNPPIGLSPVLPHQFKLTQLINDFSSIYSDTSLKHSAKIAILTAQTEYLQSLMTALIKTVPNTDRVESVNK